MALFLPGPGGGKEIDHGYKGKGSLLHLVTDKEGKPLWITTTSAKGNDFDELRMEMLRRGYLPIIGYRKNRKEKIKTEEIYACFGTSKRRWVVERSFSWLKRKCRRLLMRWERLPEVWDAFALLGLIFMRLQILLG